MVGMRIGKDGEGVEITDSGKTVTLGVDKNGDLLINGAKAVVRHPLQLSSRQAIAAVIATISAAVVGLESAVNILMKFYTPD